MTVIFGPSIGGLVLLLATAFTLGAAPIFVVRLIALLYPKGDPRRADLLAEMARVAGVPRVLERWHWFGENFADAICVGPAARLAERRAARPARQAAREQRRKEYADHKSRFHRVGWRKIYAHPSVWPDTTDPAYVRSALLEHPKLKRAKRRRALRATLN